MLILVAELNFGICVVESAAAVIHALAERWVGLLGAQSQSEVCRAYRTLCSGTDAYIDVDCISWLHG